ncbi:MAG: 50S ribosomal protein L31 [Chloroflexi bacterium]|nr:50S ribosomal protein L31 [Chloroflexota bacterium]MCY3583813.1 50S ribosomal protein L31 [Chloroflexota bacterium]MCY3716255.1 50S ribosomal protein L31 [Chloroflexota bacterium]MDE2650416.1 50S ribosomal protein L31 [Chloroflexota bacterium]MXX82158.1 50S ribosomal protein L31 [Chloroflexota bacterium]
MKQGIHPAWHATPVRCMTCGTTWTTGSTVKSLTVEICSNCHPFYTGEQRIVDTEGRVDKFMKRLQQRDQIRSQQVKREEERTPLDLPLAELKLGERYTTILQEHGITVVADVLDRLGDEGDNNSLLEIQGIGRKVVSDMKKSLRARGYELHI